MREREACALRYVAMSGKLNLNNADKDALDGIEALTGHGHEIVRYREERGGFTKVEQLDEVPGLTGKLGPDTYEQLSVR